MKWFTYLLAILIMLSLMSDIAYADETEMDIYYYISNIHDIEDMDNCYWLACSEGLVSVDKTNGEVTRYTSRNSALPQNYISALGKDTDGDLWCSVGAHGAIADFINNPTIFDIGGPDFYQYSIRDFYVFNDKMWICSGKGVLKLDGDEAIVYDVENSGLLSNMVNCAAMDSSGVLWFGTQGGISCFDGKLWKHYDRDNSGLDYSNIISILVAPDGIVWIGSSYSLTTYDSGIWEHIEISSEDFYPNSVQRLALDKQGRIWGGSLKGLHCFDGEQITSYYESSSWLENNQIRLVRSDNDGNILVQDGDNTLFKITGDEVETIKYSNCSLEHAQVGDIVIDKDDQKWIGTQNGLTLYDNYSWRTYNSRNSILPNPSITAIAVDSNNTKWYASGSSLISNTNGVWFQYNSDNSDLPANCMIITMAIDPMNRRWLGTNRGLIKMDDLDVEIYTTENTPLPRHDIKAVAFAQNGDVWCGMGLGGFARFDGTDWEVIGADILNRYPFYTYDIDLDKNGKVWVSSFSGIYTYNNNTLDSLNTSNSPIPSNTVCTMTIDKDDCKWIGTDSGLVAYDGSIWKVYNTDNSKLESNVILSIAIDSKGNKWLGTKSGVAVLHAGTSDIEMLGDREASSVVSPNPVSDKAMVEYELDAVGLAELRVYDSHGVCQIKTSIDAGQAGRNNAIIDCAALPAGPYYYNIIADGKACSGSFIVAR